MINGIDYASVDGNKPPQIEATNVSFVYQRAAYTYKDAALIDPHLSRDRDSWRQHNIPFGAYLILGYNQSGPTPEEQVDTFVKAYGDRREGELPVALDVEFPTSRATTGLRAGEALAWIHRAYDMLVGAYDIVATYTSARVWHEDLCDQDSKLGEGPLWIKVPYAYKANNRPHPETCPSVVSALPVPWQAASSPGAWIVQYQGDAIEWPGISNTVDLNGWLPGRDTQPGLWVRRQLARHGAGDVRSFQKAEGLVVDGVIGPKTFAALTKHT